MIVVAQFVQIEVEHRTSVELFHLRSMTVAGKSGVVGDWVVEGVEEATGEVPFHWLSKMVLLALWSFYSQS